jgi:ribosomal protein L34E
VYHRGMESTPAAKMARRFVRWLEGERVCHICHAPVDRAAAQRVDGFYACNTEHADDIARERAW